MPLIDVRDLGYTLPGKRLLFKNVEFKVASGQRVALVGANGVGKSTLLRIVAGEDDEHTGSVRVEGKLLYMRQFVASPDTTIRQLLLGLSRRPPGRPARSSRSPSTRPRATAPKPPGCVMPTR